MIAPMSTRQPKPLRAPSRSRSRGLGWALLAGALLLTAGCGGGSASASPVSPASASTSAATGVPGAAGSGSALPDACSLLTPGEAATLFGGGPLTARAEASTSLGQGGGIAGCVWATTPQNKEVELIVADLTSLYGGTSAQQVLLGIQGDSVSGIGDGGKFESTEQPYGLAVTKGHWLVWIRADAIASATDLGAKRLPLLETAINAALGRLPS